MNNEVRYHALMENNPAPSLKMASKNPVLIATC
jgi:hypothetical protein